MRIDPHTTTDVVIALNESLTSGRGRRLARWALERGTALRESPLESASAAVIEWLGYPAPLHQHVFGFEGAEDRGDFFWAEQNVLGEADGTIKYSGADGEQTAAIAAEKSRENRLRRHLSGVVRWGWSELENIQPLDEALRAAGLRPVRNRDSLRLATFRPFGR
ncbi:hypothetical protein ACWGJP_14520 [Microbacterium sp. NPDC055903]